jgi:hypothetical protein
MEANKRTVANKKGMEQTIMTNGQTGRTGN